MFFFNTSRGSTIQRTNLLVSIMSSRHFQNVFSVTVFRLPRRLQDVLKDAKLLHWRRVEDVFKTNKCLLGCFLLKLFVSWSAKNPLIAFWLVVKPIKTKGNRFCSVNSLSRIECFDVVNVFYSFSFPYVMC